MPSMSGLLSPPRSALYLPFFNRPASHQLHHQRSHSKRSLTYAPCLLCLWILLRNPRRIAVASLAFKTARRWMWCDSPWAAKSSRPVFWLTPGREQPAFDVQHPIICSRMRPFPRRRWSILSAWKRCVLVCGVKRERDTERDFTPCQRVHLSPHADLFIFFHVSLLECLCVLY